MTTRPLGLESKSPYIGAQCTASHHGNIAPTFTSSTFPESSLSPQRTLIVEESSSTPDIHPSQNRKNARDAPSPIFRATTQSLIPHPNASPELAKPRTILLPPAFADNSFAPQAAGPVPPDSPSLAAAIELECLSAAPAVPASPTALGRSSKGKYRQ